MSKKTLIFTAVGDYDNKSWLSEDTNCDFIIAYYGKSDEKYEQLKSISKYCFRSKGVKFQLLWSWWIHNREETKEYDIIGVLDDDLQWNSKTMNEFLSMIKTHLNNRDKSAAVYSPTHDSNGKVTREHMRQQLENTNILRKVNGIEMTWPFFERKFLDSYLMNDYEISLVGFGEGRLYSYKALKEKRNLYVSDKFSSINPTDNQKNRKNNEMSGTYPYYEKIWQIIQKERKINLP